MTGDSRRATACTTLCLDGVRLALAALLVVASSAQARAQARVADAAAGSCKDDAAFDLHRKAPHLAAYRERREKEGLTEGPAEVEIYRSITD